MSKESLQSIQKRPIFRETFSDEATTRALGGVPTAVTYQNGAAVCVTANSSKIVYQKALNGVYSVRIRLNSFTIEESRLLVDFRGLAGTGTGYIVTGSGVKTNTILVSSGTIYIDGVAGIAISSNTKEIVVTGMTINSITSFLNARYDSTAIATASYELLEIYEGTLTAQEVSNLYNNKRYKSLPPYRSGISEILNVDGKNGTITNKYSESIYGSDLIAPLDFNNWTKNSVTINNTNQFTCDGLGDAFVVKNIVTIGKRYRVNISGSVSTGGMSVTGYTPSLTGTFSITYDYTAAGAGFAVDPLGLTTATVTITNFTIREVVPTIVNTSVTSVRSDGINVMDFNGSTSKLDCGSYFNGTGDITLYALIKTRSYGGASSARLFSNGKLELFYAGTIRMFSDGSTNSSSGDVIPFGISKLVVITRTSAGVTNFYINGVLSGTANQSSGTPVAGTTNLTIGNLAGGGRTFDGNIIQCGIINGILNTDEISQMWSSLRKYVNA